MQGCLGRGDHTVVGHLTAHFGIERGLIQNHQHACLGAVVGSHGVHQLAAIAQSQHLAAVLQGGVAGKHGGLGVQLGKQVCFPAGNILGQTLLAGTLFLLIHFAAESFFIHSEAALGSDLFHKIQREAEGIVQLKCLDAAQNAGFAALHTVDQAVENVHACIDGFIEACFLGANDLFNIFFMLTQLGIAHLAALDHGIHQLHQEGAVDAQHTAMAGSAAQQTAQHIAAALIAGQHTVAHHKHGGTDMVGDHADGNIVVLILAVLFARDLFHMVQHALHGVDLEQIAHALHYAGQALQAHAGINVGLGQALVVALAVGIELAEHQVPDLHVAVAFAAHMAIGPAAAELGATVKINFRAGAAGAGAMLPEVIFLAKANHVVGRNADLLGPDIVSLIVLFVNRNE